VKYSLTQGTLQVSASSQNLEFNDELPVAYKGEDFHVAFNPQFVIDALKHLPSLGQAVKLGNWRFEVVDLDGRRVDKVLASRLPDTHRPARRVTTG